MPFLQLFLRSLRTHPPPAVKVWFRNRRNRRRSQRVKSVISRANGAPDWDAILPLGFPGLANRLNANWKDTDYCRARKVAVDGAAVLMVRLVESVAALDAKGLSGDFPLDVAFLPGTVAGEKGLNLMRTLIKRYFDNGGLVIQFNVADPQTLRDAQAHPEKYENLQVRVENLGTHPSGRCDKLKITCGI